MRQREEQDLDPRVDAMGDGSHSPTAATDCGTCRELRAALMALRVDANRLCDRMLGGTYEEDCRRTIAVVDAVIAKTRERSPVTVPSRTPTRPRKCLNGHVWSSSDCTFKDGEWDWRCDCGELERDFPPDETQGWE